MPELSEDDKQRIMASEDFVRFFDRASRLVMRALADSSDFTKDYAREGKEDAESDLGADRLTFSHYYVDDHWSRHRGVMRLDWSTQYPELLLAAYNTNEEAHHDPDGVALVWNTKWNTQTPEYIFHCQSAVTSATFTNFHPNLIIGGTYSGQIVLWDNRSSKRTPVQRSPLSSNAHTHPVYCVTVVGTQNAHNLISTSTDGKLCSWSLDMLSQPQDKLELQYQTKSIAVMCMDFPPGEINNFVVGSEEGSVFMGSRLGSKAGISNHFEGHFGPITGIDFNSPAGRHDFSHLFLTSSFDWTVKLWSERHSSCLHSFEDSGDYVFDVQWSPINPALFATVDGTKRLDLWQINRDIEVPYCSETLDCVAAPNCVRWSKGGTILAIGDADGKLHIYSVGEHIAQPRADEWSHLRSTLQDLQTRSAQPLEMSHGTHTPF
jgi:dynein intermediate chain